MSYIPAVAFIWYGRNYSRTLFVPTRVLLCLFQSAPVTGLPAGDDLDDSVEKVGSLGEMTARFVAGDPRDNQLFDVLFDDVSKMALCSEEYCEYDDDNAVVMPDIPPGMAIVQWHAR